MVELSENARRKLTDPNFAYLRGRVVDIVEGEEADRHIDSLAWKYMGYERYPWRRPGKRRITVRVEPLSVNGMG